MGWLRSGLFRRVALVMGLLALVPVAFLAWRILGANRAAVQDAVLELHMKLAEIVQQRLGRIHPGPNRGVKQSGFLVLITASMPAVANRCPKA